jgi:anti-sigma B factor antagonist
MHGLLRLKSSLVTSANQPLNIEVVDRPSGARLLSLRGALVMQSLFDFQAIVRQNTERDLMIDLSGVPYMDSAGLGSVINAFTASSRQGLKFALVGVSGRIRTLFAVSRVDGFLPSFESVELAEESFQK